MLRILISVINNFTSYTNNLIYGFVYLITNSISSISNSISAISSISNSIVFNTTEQSIFKIGTVDSEGIDLPITGDYSNSSNNFSRNIIVIPPKEFCKLTHSLSIKESNNCYAEIWPRSSASKYGLIVIPGVIDSDYRGPIMTAVYNTNNYPVILKRINNMFPSLSQLIVKQRLSSNLRKNIFITYTSENQSYNCMLQQSQIRGIGGFGSTN
jgi:dUTPase